METYFSVVREELDDSVIVRVGGEIDVAAADALAAALQPDGGRPLVVDLSATTFMDSTGVRALVTAQRTGVHIAAIRNVPPRIKQLFEVLGLTQVLPIDP